MDIEDLLKLPKPTADEAVIGMEAAKNRAAVALDHTLLLLHAQAMTKGNTVKQLLDMSEHFAKISGLSAKQMAQAAPSTRITFNFGAKQPAGATIEGQVVVESIEEKQIDPTPEITQSIAFVGIPVTSDLMSYDD